MPAPTRPFENLMLTVSVPEADIQDYKKWLELRNKFSAAYALAHPDDHATANLLGENLITLKKGPDIKELAITGTNLTAADYGWKDYYPLIARVASAFDRPITIDWGMGRTLVHGDGRFEEMPNEPQTTTR